MSSALYEVTLLFRPTPYFASSVSIFIAPSFHCYRVVYTKGNEAHKARL